MNRTSAQDKSEYVMIFKWHLRKKRFKLHQNLTSSLPRDVEHFEIDGDHYLAVANHGSARSSEGMKGYCPTGYLVVAIYHFCRLLFRL